MVIGIYPRKSVYRDNSDSVQVQVQLCKDYARIIFKDRQPLEFRIYDKDEGFSGKNTNRPSFRELMADVRQDMLDAVMVYKLDRISRNVQEFSAMYEVFYQHNVSFISVKEAFDTTTPMGRTVMYILAAFAQLERENTSERVADNMQALGAAGKWTGGTLPTGFTSVRRRIGSKEHSFLQVDPATVGLVQLLYRLILQGNPITAVERYCRDNGIRSRSGKFLNTSQIYGIITNPVYCQNSPEAFYYFSEKGCTLPDLQLFDGTRGLIGYGRTKTGNTSQKAQSMDHWTIAIGIHEPVMPAADWISAQQRLGINKMYHQAKYDVGILKGVLRCSCGARMDVRTYVKHGRRFSYYYCTAMSRQGRQACDSGYVKVDILERAFLAQLRQIRLHPEFHLRPDPLSLPDTKTLQAEIRRIDDSISNLTSALAQAMETSAAGYIVKQIDDLDGRKRKLESSLRKAMIQASQVKSTEESYHEIYSCICWLLDNLEHVEYRAKNELIRKIVKSCVFDAKKEDLRIIF